MKSLIRTLGFCVLTLLLHGCSLAPFYRFPAMHVGMVHDYIYEAARQECAQHLGLHYIVSLQTIEMQNSGHSDFDDYPCTNTYRFRCQDGALLTYNDGMRYCYIPQEQLQETLKGRDLRGTPGYSR